MLTWEEAGSAIPSVPGPDLATCRIAVVLCVEAPRVPPSAPPRVPPRMRLAGLASIIVTFLQLLLRGLAVGARLDTVTCSGASTTLVDCKATGAADWGGADGGAIDGTDDAGVTVDAANGWPDL